VDYDRLCEQRARQAPFVTGGAWLSASFLCVLLYRLSNHFYRARHHWISRALWHLNVLLTGADISDPADLGAGLVVLHPPGTSIMGTAGRNLLVAACCGIGGEVGRHTTVAGWPGVPLIGDDVVLEPHSGIIGPVRIGDRVRVGAGTIVCRDVPDDTLVESPRVRFLRHRAES
jgi:serine O-acetyltransferase